MHNRTEKQVAADNAIYNAIQQCMQAYGIDNAILGDYLIVTAVERLGPNDTVSTGYPMFMPNGDIPWYRIQGLLDMANFQINNQITTRTGDDE